MYIGFISKKQDNFNFNDKISGLMDSPRILIWFAQYVKYNFMNFKIDMIDLPQQSSILHEALNVAIL